MVRILLLPSFGKTDTLDNILDDDADLAEILDDIDHIDIDTASLDELISIPFITRSEATLIIGCRDSLGTIILPDGTLRSITGLSALQQSILNQIATTEALPSWIGNVDGAVRTGIQYDPSYESISDSKYYMKVTAETEHRISVNVIGDHDVLEPRAIDFFSSSVAWHSEDRKKNIVIGDFRPSFGQRLLFSRYSRNYLDGTHIFMSTPNNIMNTSFEESRFLRGGYISYMYGPFTIDAYTSYRKLDATVDESGNAVTIRTSGLHADTTYRENLTEKVSAFGITAHNGKFWQFSILGTSSQYNPMLSQTPDERTINHPEGNRFSYLSTAGSITTQKSRLFYEYVSMNGGEHAAVIGMETGMDTITGSVLLREYSSGYWALRSAGIHSFGSTANERGIYLALTGRIPKRGSYSVSYDIARTLSRTFRTNMPATRRRINVHGEYYITPFLNGQLSVRSVDDIETNDTRTTVKAMLDCPKTANIQMRWRFTSALIRNENTSGIYCEWRITPKIPHMHATFILAGFDIPGYDVRYYRYEPNVPGQSMSSPVWDTGASVSCVLRFQFASFRYGYTSTKYNGANQECTFQLDAQY